MVGVEAAGCPALVLHPVPSCRAEAFPAQRQRPCPDDIGASVPRGSLAQQMRAERMAWADVLVEGVTVLYLRSCPRLRPARPCRRRGDILEPPSPAAAPAFGGYYFQALVF